MKGYVIEFLDENDYKKKESSLKKYNMLAYKKLIFDFLPQLKKGIILGELISKNKENNSEDYELQLPTNEYFSKVHGNLKIHYTVYKDDNVITLNNITPEAILAEGHQTELNTYKGVMISKKNSEKDIFKINLLNVLNK